MFQTEKNLINTTQVTGIDKTTVNLIHLCIKTYAQQIYMLMLLINIDYSVVELSRVVYQEPDLPLSQKKSEVILAKKTVLIGEVVNGGPLPKPLQHTPVCSFDSQNRYRGEGPLDEPTPSQFRGNCSSS